MLAEGRYRTYYNYRTPASIVFKRKSGCFYMCGEIEKMKTGSCSNQTDARDGVETTNLPSGDRIEASVALQVLPWVDMEQVVQIVDCVIEYIQSTGIRYVVGPFETTMEGDLDVLLDIVKEAQHIAIRMGAPEVLSMVKIAYRPDAAGSMTIESKTAKYQV